jgi:hypothetical protein
MSDMPDKTQQILQAHAALIWHVVRACQNRDLMPQIEPILQASEANGWNSLVGVIRRILSGERHPKLLVGLDEEDSIIVTSIMRGLQDPGTLPDPDARPDPAVAAAGMAQMIHEAMTGSTQALGVLGDMAEQMLKAGGDMARLGGILRRLLDGERDPDLLARGMGQRGEQFVAALLEELGRRSTH